MSSPHKRKRVIVKLTPEQESDPQSILDAVREALKEQTGKVLEVRKVPGEPALPPRPDPPDGGRMSLEQLECAALDHATAILRQKTEELQDKPARFDWKKWWERVQALGEFCEKHKEFLVAILDRVAKSIGAG